MCQHSQHKKTMEHLMYEVQEVNNNNLAGEELFVFSPIL